MRSRATGRWLAAIVALAAALRLWHLGHESVWIDEAFTVTNARLPLAQLAAFSARDIYPPLYSFFMALWVRAFGASEFSIRLPAAIFGTWAVLLVARLAARLYGARAALAAAFVAATSVFLVHYSQEARSYGLLALLSAASLLAYLDGFERWTRRRALAYLAVTLALVYTHHAGWFVVAAQHGHFAWAAWRHARLRPAWRRWGSLQLLLLAGFLPWLGVVRGQMHHLAHAFWNAPPNALVLPKLAWEFAGSPPLLLIEGGLIALALAPHWRAFASIAAPISGAETAGAGTRATAPPLPERGPTGAAGSEPGGPVPERAALVLLWTLIPIVAPYALACLGYGTFVARVAISSALALAVLAGAGVAHLRSPRWTLAVLAALGAFALADYYGVTHKEPWRPAIADLERDAHAGDLVLIHAGYNFHTSWRYYARRGDLRVLPVYTPGSAFAGGVPDSLRRAFAAADRAWLVLSRSDDREHALRDALRAGHAVTRDTVYASRSYEPSRTREFAGIEVLRFERPPAASR